MPHHTASVFFRKTVTVIHYHNTGCLVNCHMNGATVCTCVLEDSGTLTAEHSAWPVPQDCRTVTVTAIMHAVMHAVTACMTHAFGTPSNCHDGDIY